MPAAANIFPASDGTIKQAAQLIARGKLVAFPTETVYGLGADATNDKAIAALFAAKNRPDFNPLIIHIAKREQLDELVEPNDAADQLIEHFWPGPLTLVLKRKQGCAVSLLASAGLDTLAVRMPDHPTALKLITLAGKPIAAPSANRSGTLSPTIPMHVAESLGNKVDMILAEGKCKVGVESTVLDLTGETPTILRHGGVTRERLARILDNIESSTHDDPARPKSPGQMASHYAPKLPLRMEVSEAGPDEAFLLFGPAFAFKGGALRLNLSEAGDLEEAAASLFAKLRELDQPRFKGIAVAPIHEQGIGAAINDRLRRAAAPRD
ncbi:MAG: threonylcarbamoyl-AMP synthase [Alphaproteobacteria bacterium]|nr:threonylcarbamoyl-AMP synthase [Alphaproteobacteria bacterium]